MKINKQNKIKKVLKYYYNDEVDIQQILKMNSTVTFEDVFNAPEYFYKMTGLVESHFRIRIFEMIASLYKCNYDLLYYRWLCKENNINGLYVEIDKNIINKLTQLEREYKLSILEI